ncbi:peptidyl-prolyl cis-trans isomerase [Pseudoalteromonas sp. T1lg23B]|uniref:peptidylprolyl isomerase n=1 Tax=Pseudoalteromonas sp. T1lg23B TaxID=2077097 RepID=UPI001F44408C|nr:peptidylprolyl isomerase [Pseudoalteromonas sp. T1lg23B]
MLVLLVASLFSLPLFAQLNFSQSEIKLVHNVLQEKAPSLSLRQAKERLLENAFLLAQAKRHQPAILHKQSAVGFSSDYHARRFTLVLLKSQFDLPNVPALDDNAFAPYTSLWLLDNLPNYPSNNIYSQQQLAQLERVDLTHLANAPLTLATLMNEQSMQNRYKLHQGEINLFKSLIAEHRRFNLTMQLLADKLQTMGLSKQRLLEIAKAELLRPVMLTYFGVLHSMHGEHSAYVEQLQAKITQQQINDYFKANKNDFRYIAQVHSQAVLFKEKEQASQFYHYAKQHSFEQALSQFKQRDLFAQTDGLVKRKQQNSWAEQLAFSLLPNKLSKPVRTPQGEWLVATTLKRQYSYYQADSETVKYQAKIALTDSLATAEYEKLKKQWFRQHKATL